MLGHMVSCCPHILMNKLLAEMCFIISHEFGGGYWDVEDMMSITNREIKMKEQSPTSNNIQKHSMKGTSPTSSTFFNHSGQSSRCVYCGQVHLSSSCTVVTEVSVKREILHKSDATFV